MTNQQKTFAINSLKRTIAALVLVLTLCPACLFGQTARQPALFADGERVCFIGDSITHGNYDESDYHEFIYLYYLTRFPERRITIFDRGISGENAGGTVARFAEEIAPCKATVCTIMLGMNDVDRDLYGSSPTCSPETQAQRNAKLKLYREQMEKLCKLVAGTGSRLVIFTPSPFDQTSDSPGGPGSRSPDKPRVNDGLMHFADSCRTLAENLGAPLVDMNGGMLRVAAEQQKTNPFFSLQPKDRTHPDVNGAFIMAYLFLKAQNAPAAVSTVVLDAGAGKLVQNERCKVGELVIGEDSASFVLTAEALPFPTDEIGAWGLRLVPFMEDLNQETFRVKRLKPGAYALKIDGGVVGQYDASELADGINLAGNSLTPQHRQAAKVAAVNMQRDNLSCKLRGIALVDFKTLNRLGTDKADMAKVNAYLEKALAGMEGETWHPFMKTQFANYLKDKPQAGKIEAELAGLEEKLYQINRSEPHRYELTRIGDNLPLPVAENITEPEGLTFYLPFDKSVAALKIEPACAAIEPAAVTYEAGPVGDAVIIASKDGLRYNEPQSFPLNESSIAFWIKPHWDPGDIKVTPCIFRKDREGLEKPSGNKWWHFNDQIISFYPDDQFKDKTRIVYQSTSGSGGDGEWQKGGLSYAKWVVSNWGKNQWLHACVTVGNVGRQFRTRMYVQGNLVFTWDWDTPPQAHARTFTLAGGGQTMSLDDFRAYNRVLDPEEVYELHRMGARRAEYLNRRPGAEAKP